MSIEVRIYSPARARAILIGFVLLVARDSRLALAQRSYGTALNPSPHPLPEGEENATILASRFSQTIDLSERLC